MGGCRCRRPDAELLVLKFLCRFYHVTPDVAIMWVKLDVFKEHFLPEFSAGSQFVVLNSSREIPKGLKESLKTSLKNSTEGWSGQFGLWDWLQQALHSAYTVIHIKPENQAWVESDHVFICSLFFTRGLNPRFSIFIVEGRWFLRSVDLPLMHIIPVSQPEIKNRCLGQKSFQTLTRPVKHPVWARSGGTFSCSWGGCICNWVPMTMKETGNLWSKINEEKTWKYWMLQEIERCI